MITATRHREGCKRVFRTYDLACPRCKELAGGAVARMGYGERERRRDATSLRWIKAHDCRKAGCGPICTFGDW